MSVGVELGRFAGMVRRMEHMSVGDMRVVRGQFVVFFGVVFGGFAVVDRSMLEMFSSFRVMFSSFVVFHGVSSFLEKWTDAGSVAGPRGNPMGF